MQRVFLHAIFMPQNSGFRRSIIRHVWVFTHHVFGEKYILPGFLHKYRIKLVLRTFAIFT